MEPLPARYSSRWRDILPVLHGFASLSADHALRAGMSWGSLPFRTARSARSLDAPLTAACSCLMGLVLLAMLCLGRPDVPAFADSARGGASVGLERSGEVAALLRVTNKAQALEARATRPVIAKFAGGHPALPAPQADFFWFAPTSAAVSAVGHAMASAPAASANQPRAPPFTQA